MPGLDFHRRGEVAGDAGEATALWDATKEVSVNLAKEGHYRHLAACEFFSFDLDVSLVGAS